jgi:rhamnose utilization protein RhaD (predicted bifunctional aldolase and dehydrogenase)/NAD(P)-dependent dehydrogenase (short-subunit alcohol dehydrogenase family)
MQSQWSDEDAKATIAHYVKPGGRVNEDIALRVYTSRLIGQDPSLVLHGGGNTSVKTRLRDDLGDTLDVLCVKGSGWDLAAIEPAGLPALRLEPLRALRRLDRLSDEAMVNAQRVRLLDASAPNPSVETLLHAFLPHKFIDHSHADAILSLVDQPDAERLCGEVFAGRLALVPYVMPGFELAKLAAEVLERAPAAEGLLLLRHGLFTFGATAREAYERHVAAVSAAEDYIERSRRTRRLVLQGRADLDLADFGALLRGKLGEGARRYVFEARTSASVRAFVDDPALEARSQRGVATPDHVIRTKRLPLVLDVGRQEASCGLAAHIDERLEAYRAAYRDYVARQTEAKGVTVKPLDPDPRVILLSGLGLLGVGETKASARIAADIYEHTIDVIDAADAIGAYEPLPEGELFDMEYWSLEQAKLGKGPKKPLAGRVVYLTGAGRGIGAATARAFAAAGAMLYLVDREEPALSALAEALDAPSEVLDVTDEAAVRASVRRCVRAYGGLDGCVSNAGTAPQAAIDECEPGLLRASLEVNLLAHQWVAAAVTSALKAQGMGGFLLFNASKAAFNPGPGFGPYAIAKAALVALMKQYALEGGASGIRANAVNADRIRTGLFPDAMVEARASARGLAPDEYFRANLLHREVSAEDVAQAFVALALAESTTGSIFTVDGGNIAAAPR